MRFLSLLERTEATGLIREAVAERLGINARVEALGAALPGGRRRVGRLARSSPQRALEGELERIRSLSRDANSDFTAKDFH